ncbi:hypothetical protein BJY04DRAFT_51037 [Aspergillus karnatakaensis]|uniref:uncharacterized protein n=1 Tax=Aspergillus karnatakaensis TaxID=1810916 RepID=UPI003CCDF8A4
MSTQPQFPPEYLAEDRGNPAVIGMAVTTAVATVVVFIRTYARGFMIKELGWDDGLIIVAMLFSWAVVAFSYKVIQYGAGRHLVALVQNPAGMVLMYKWLIAAQITYFFVLWICRLSGIAFYARLNPMPRFTLYLRISYGFVTAVYIAQTLIIALQCVPLSALWGEAEGNCMGQYAVFISTSVMTIICDSLILLLPINIIFTIKAKLIRKLALGVVLCFGVFAVVTSICRIVAMVVALDNQDDITWYFSVVLTWSCAEIATAIVALSLPALKGLFNKLSSTYRSTVDNSGSNTQDNYQLKSNASSARRRIFEGPNASPNDAHIASNRNNSEEQLWDGKGDNIRVVDTVEVNVQYSEREGYR